MGKRVLFTAAGFVAGVAATLYLGHVTVKPGERRLAMIRLDLGRRGLINVGLNDTNGEPVP